MEAEIINVNNIHSIINNLENNIAKELISMQCQLNDIGINYISVDSGINDELSEELVYTPFYFITKAKLAYFNGNVKEAEEIINYFWFIYSDPEPPFEWWYENYRSFLLQSIRIGLWDGARLPMWLARYMDVYSDNDKFRGLSYTFKVFVNTVTSHIKNLDN